MCVREGARKCVGKRERREEREGQREEREGQREETERVATSACTSGCV